MSFFPFANASEPSDSALLGVVEAERQRQLSQLIMIPSESICHPAVVSVLASELGNIYAEGLPQPLLCPNPRTSARDTARFAGWQTRLADRRFYKGTVAANRAELVAQDSIARVFAALEDSPAPENIHVNVQPLSGAAANLAVFEALLEPGDSLMGLDLAHGGHLTHGSQFNFSGKTYEVHSYGVRPGESRLDYDHIRDLARKYRPRLIIGGASAYPWDFDWQRMRAIADDVGAWLLADVAHLAGMIAAGVLRNPLPHAHVVTFTTHKTLCGPRGAAILTTNPDVAGKIDNAVFPGLQGGPHMNSIAAIGRLFELILDDFDGFRTFQQSVVSHTRHFARCLRNEGFTLVYGGTDTHMVLVNLTEFPVEGPVPLDGEIASRLLELAGIVCNKNLIPGDDDAAHASGLRFGLPWLTQRGVTDDHIRRIASIIKQVLSAVRTFSIISPGGEDKCRGRVPSGVLREAFGQTQEIVRALPYPPVPSRPGASRGPKPLGDRAVLLLRGDKVRLALGQLLTARLPIDGTAVTAKMLRDDGSVIDDVIVVELPSDGNEEKWLVLPHSTRAEEVSGWISDLSEGYLLFDESDLQKKIDGPTVVEQMDATSVPPAALKAIERAPREPAVDLTKTYFVGQRKAYAETTPTPKPEYVIEPVDLPVRKTPLNRAHHDLGGKMVPFAGWEMPVQYPAGIFAEHRAVRTSAGLFDVSHMSVLEAKGPHACAFLDQLLANCVSRLAPGTAQYSCILRPDGSAIDDIFVYRLEVQRYLLVVNAANAEAVIDWVSAVNVHRVLVDDEMPDKELDGPVVFRALRDAGQDSLVGLALQGPVSLRVLQTLVGTGSDTARLRSLKPNDVVSLRLAGMDSVVARTGYTGEKVAFEVMTHPEHLEDLWNRLLDAGTPMGVLPAGLGARDSTRVEAGFPLFGHELEGGPGLSLTEAGYGYVPRFHVPFFVGRAAYMRRVETSRRHILRLAGQGKKTLRAGHTILDGSGGAVGQVTSFAYVHRDLTFVVLACVDEGFSPEPGEKTTGARIPAGTFAGDYEERSVVELTALERFPTDDERDAWPEVYA